MKPLHIEIETKNKAFCYRVKSDYLLTIKEPLLFKCSLFKKNSASGKEIRFFSFYDSFFFISKVILELKK